MFNRFEIVDLKGLFEIIYFSHYLVNESQMGNVNRSAENYNGLNKNCVYGLMNIAFNWFTKNKIESILQKKKFGLANAFTGHR